MHSEGKRCLSRSFGLDVLGILLITQILWRTLEGNVLAVDEWEQLNFVEKTISHQAVEHGSAHNSVPAIDNMAAVHDLSEQVPEIVPWNLSSACSSFKVV